MITYGLIALVIFPLIERGYTYFTTGGNDMPLDLNDFLKDDYEEIIFGDDKFRVPAYLPPDMAMEVAQIQEYNDLSALTPDKMTGDVAGRVRKLFALEKRIIIGILTTKRDGKPVNDPRKVKKFVTKLPGEAFAKVFAFVFAYFTACADKKKASSAA